MLMNGNELTLSINKRLQDSGIIEDITDFFHEHSEYFTKCRDDESIISACDIDIAMCCKPKERQNTGVFISIDLGAHGAVQDYLSDHSRSTDSKVTLQHRKNREEVSKHVYN